MVSRTMMTVLLGIDHKDPDIKNYIQAADDVINSIFTLPINLPGFAFRKVSSDWSFLIASSNLLLEKTFLGVVEDIFVAAADK